MCHKDQKAFSALWPSIQRSGHDRGGRGSLITHTLLEPGPGPNHPAIRWLCCEQKFKPMQALLVVATDAGIQSVYLGAAKHRATYVRLHSLHACNSAELQAELMHSSGDHHEHLANSFRSFGIDIAECQSCEASI